MADRRHEDIPPRSGGAPGEAGGTGRARPADEAGAARTGGADGARHTAEDLPAGALAARLGIVVLEASPDRAVAVMPVAGNTQPAGLLHGGASAALAETVASLAAQLHAGEGRAAVGVELNASHHRPARAGSVTATAVAVHRGRSMATYGVTVTDDAGRTVCTARLTCAVLDLPSPGDEAVDEA